MDILGFKQIVENNETGKLLEIIRTFFQEFDSAVDKSRTYNSSSGKPDKICLHQLNFRLMSDSILIWTKENTFSTFRNLLEATRELVAVGLENGFPLRGVLTYGDLIASKHIKCQFFSSDSIYGKALVEAYTLEKEMEWSGCWKLFNHSAVRDGFDVESDIHFCSFLFSGYYLARAGGGGGTVF